MSLNGIGLDFAKGVTEQVSRVAPGEVKVACWPGSKHGGHEPKRIPIRIEDPGNHWIASELDCPRDKVVANAILDYVSGSTGTEGDPEKIAREQVKGIESGDQIFTVGYPEAEYREVAVERAGEIVAILSYSPAQAGGWLLARYSACNSARIRV